MENIVTDKPNLVAETVPVKEASVSLDTIAQKMAAMKSQVLRNLPPATENIGTGSNASADAVDSVAPEGVEVSDDYNTDSIEPEVGGSETEYEEGNDEAIAPTEVSTADSTSEDIIDFLEFAEQHPNAKFKFKRNGQTIEIDAKKAASILGQGAAISEDARQLKIEKSEFDEYSARKRQETESLLLAMEFTVQPRLQGAYDEIMKTQGYQATFQQQLAQAQDPATRARIQANMQQNERYIAQQAQIINQIKPNLDHFMDLRRQQVSEVLENNRKNFKDKELRNQYVYNEIKDKVAKIWPNARGQLVAGVDNIDLISSDEHVLGLIRDGLKYRDRPQTKSSGSSIAALTNRRGGTSIPNMKDQLTSLQEKARSGDVKAQDNLLVAKMNALRQQRTR